MFTTDATMLLGNAKTPAITIVMRFLFHKKGRSVGEGYGVRVNVQLETLNIYSKAEQGQYVSKIQKEASKLYSRCRLPSAIYPQGLWPYN